MKIFISWSGEKSKAAAEYINKWIKQVLQSTNPWISSGIEKGRSWSSEISEKLSESDFGIICLTKENLNSNWIHFEAGAIIKGTKGNGYILLVDIEPTELESPLNLFQATKLEKTDVYRLLNDINKKLPDPLEIDVLKEVFETNWSKFEMEMQEITNMEYNTKVDERRSTDDMIEEILLNSRHIDKNIVDALNWIIDNTKLENVTVGYATSPPVDIWGSRVKKINRLRTKEEEDLPYGFTDDKLGE